MTNPKMKMTKMTLTTLTTNQEYNYCLESLTPLLIRESRNATPLVEGRTWSSSTNQVSTTHPLIQAAAGQGLQAVGDKGTLPIRDTAYEAREMNMNLSERPVRQG